MTSPNPPSPSADPGAASTPDQPAADTFVLTLPDDPASGKDWYLWTGVLALLVFVAFFPATNGGLVWDDEHHAGLIANYPTLDGLGQIWTPGKATPQYYPLTFTTFWLDYHIWKDNPLGYHLGNLLLHAGAAVLVWRLLKRLGLPGAWVAATIWAVHPLQAESVCWISERKNVLSGLLFFASIWFYLEYAELTPPPASKPGPGLSADNSTYLLNNRSLVYCLSLLLLVLGLLAKTVVCAMPAVMLILLWWKGRRLLDRKTWLGLIPFFIVGIAMSITTVFLETAPGGNVEALGPDWNISPIQRLLIAGRGVWFYVAKLIAPQNLTFSYPHPFPSIEAIGSAMYAVQWIYVIAAVAVVAFLWHHRNKNRGPLAAVLYYGLTLFPALGFINIYPMRYSFVADHFQYLSGLGLIVLAVAGLAPIFERTLRKPAAVATISALLLAALLCQSWLQAHIYESPESLYRDTLAKNPDSWMASDNLGIQLIRLGEQKQQEAATDQSQGNTDAVTDDNQAASDYFKEAEKWLQHALSLRPNNYATYNALGLLYRQTNRWDQAESTLRTAVDLDDHDDIFHQLTAPYVNYARVLQHLSPDADMRPWLDKALALEQQPRIKSTDLAVAHLAYGDYWMGRAAAASKLSQTVPETASLNSAVSEYELGLAKLTTDPNGLYNLATACRRLSELDQDQANQALAAGHVDQATTLNNKSQNIDAPQAIEAYLAFLSIVKNSAGAEEGLGELYARNQRDNLEDALRDLLLAMQCFKDALSVDPKVPNAASNLAALSRQFMQDGLNVRDHESTWEKLRPALLALANDTQPAGQITQSAAIAADKPAFDALWPLTKDNPLRQPLTNFRAALHNYLSPPNATQPAATPPSPDSAATDATKRATALHDAAANVLKVWNTRIPARDAVTDAMSATLCFEAAVTCDEHSAEAWTNLKSSADTLAKAMAAQPDVPGANEAMGRATFVLDQRRAATQPTTMPMLGPTTAPATQMAR